MKKSLLGIYGGGWLRHCPSHVCGAVLFRGGNRSKTERCPVPSGGHSPHPPRPQPAAPGGGEGWGGRARVRRQVFQQPSGARSWAALSSLFQEVKPNSRFLPGQQSWFWMIWESQLTPLGFILKTESFSGTRASARLLRVGGCLFQTRSSGAMRVSHQGVQSASPSPGTPAGLCDRGS